MAQILLKMKRYDNIVNLILGYFFVLGYCNYFGNWGPTLIRRSFFNVLLFAMSLFILSHRSKQKRILKISMLFGFFCSVVLFVGKSIDVSDGFQILFETPAVFVGNFISVVGVAAVLTALFSRGLELLDSMHVAAPMEKGVGIKHFLVIWGMILLSWLPCYLSYFPGILSYDSVTQLHMAFNGFSAYTDHHPPLHTMILQLCINIGQSANIEPIVLYSILQMLLLSAVLSYLVVFTILNISGSRRCTAFIILFFMVNPVVALFSFMMTKDSFFAIAYVLITVFLYEYIMFTDRYLLNPLKCLSFFAALLCGMLFRNNMVYVVVGLGILLLIIGKGRKYRMVTVGIFLSAFLVFRLITGPVYKSVGIAGSGIHEMVGVPMQQIALVYREDSKNLSPQMLREMERFIDLKKLQANYNKRFYDRMKPAIKKGYLSQHRREFFSLWLKLSVKYPCKYVRAFLMLNLPYWYPDAKTIDDYAKRIYIETGIYKSRYYTFERRPVFPELFKLYQKVANYSLVQNTPILNILVSTTLPIWLLLALVAILIARKKYLMTFVILPSILLWGTYMFGPVSNFRYMFPIVLLYPFYIVVVLSGQHTTFRYSQINS